MKDYNKLLDTNICIEESNGYHDMIKVLLVPRESKTMMFFKYFMITFESNTYYIDVDNETIESGDYMDVILIFTRYWDHYQIKVPLHRIIYNTFLQPISKKEGGEYEKN